MVLLQLGLQVLLNRRHKIYSDRQNGRYSSGVKVFGCDNIAMLLDSIVMQPCSASRTGHFWDSVCRHLL